MTFDLHFTLMNYLLVIAHADPTGVSSAHRLAQAAKESLEGAGKTVKVLDLLKEGFTSAASQNDFNNINIKRYNYGSLQEIPNNLKKELVDQQELIKWCDYLLIFTPIWYFRPPGILFTWFDRIITVNFKISDKKLLIIATVGADMNYYTHATGNFTALDAMLYTTTFAFNYIGFKVFETQGVYSLPAEDDAKFVADLNRWKKAVLKIDKRRFLPFGTKNDRHDEIEAFIQLKPISLEEAENL